MLRLYSGQKSAQVYVPHTQLGDTGKDGESKVAIVALMPKPKICFIRRCLKIGSMPSGERFFAWRKKSRRLGIFFCFEFPMSKMPTMVKKGKAYLFMPCPLSSISCRGRCNHPDLKSSKQVVHLREHLLKVQIYQPLSKAGCVLLWQVKRIFVIIHTLRNHIFLSIAHFRP